MELTREFYPVVEVQENCACVRLYKQFAVDQWVIDGTTRVCQTAMKRL